MVSSELLPVDYPPTYSKESWIQEGLAALWLLAIREPYFHFEQIWDRWPNGIDMAMPWGNYVLLQAKKKGWIKGSRLKTPSLRPSRKRKQVTVWKSLIFHGRDYGEIINIRSSASAMMQEATG